MITLQQIKNFLNPFKGATALTNGRKGLVPAPKINEIDEFYLNSTGIWKQVKSFKTLPNNTNFNTITQDGFYKVFIPDNSIDFNQPIITNTTYGTTWVIIMCTNVQTAYAHGLSAGYPNTYRRRLIEGNTWETWQDNKANITADNINVSNYLTKLGFTGTSKATNGYYKMPNGIIIQWGTVSNITNDGTVTVNLPTTYPTTIVYANWMQNTSSTATGGAGVQTVQIVSNSQIILRNGLDTSAPAKWITVGY